MVHRLPIYRQPHRKPGESDRRHHPPQPCTSANSRKHLSAPIARLLIKPRATALFTALLLALLTLLLTADARAQSGSLTERLEHAAALIREQRLDDAEQELTLLVRRAPNSAEAHNLLGAVYASQGNLVAAETHFLRAARVNPRLLGAQMNLAYLYVLKGAPERSIAALQRVLALDAEHREAFEKLPRLLLSVGRVDDALRLLEAANRARLTPALLVTRGDAYLKKEALAQAEKSYQQVLDGKPEKGAASDVLGALYGLAQVAHRQGDGEAATDYLLRAGQLVGDAPEPLYGFAVVALKIAKYEEALAALTRAIRLRPDEATYHLALGALWLKKPELFAAEQAFREALKLEPQSAQGQMYLGYALLKQKRYGEARALLESAAKRNAGIPEPLYYLGLLAQEENDEARAVRLLAGVAQRFPAYANARIALGTSFLKLKNYARARQELEQAVKLSPDDVRAHYQLAILYARLQDGERAKQQMQIVERLRSRGGQASDGDIAPPNLR